MSIQDAKVGDQFVRLLSSAKIPMLVQVVKVDEQLLHCDRVPPVINDGVFWRFLRSTGAEYDPDLGWDGITMTGSYLVEKEDVDDAVLAQLQRR